MNRHIRYRGATYVSIALTTQEALDTLDQILAVLKSAEEQVKPLRSVLKSGIQDLATAPDLDATKMLRLYPNVGKDLPNMLRGLIEKTNSIAGLHTSLKKDRKLLADLLAISTPTTEGKEP